MKTIITTDNYEAYLLDYMEGNLSPDEAEQLKAFVAAQGLDWDELTEELPHLEAPQIAYEGKESLMQRSLSPYKSRSLSPSKGRPQRNIIPLYVKIASVAAAAGLLLTVSLWPEKQLPKVEPIANLKPIEVSRIVTHEPTNLLPRRAIERMDSLPRTSLRRDDMLSESQNKGRNVAEREAMPLLAELPTKTITALQTDLPLTNFDAPDFDFLAWHMNTDLALAQIDDYSADDEIDERDLSFIERGIYRLTEGRHDSIEDLIFSGLTTAKKELTLAATDFALTTYHQVDERFEEAKEQWEEKLGE